MTKLQVGNTDFLINSLIDRCPNTMMLRELVTNAIEASKKAKKKLILIRVTKWNGSDKLSIWNTGPGMSFSELRNACDISSSINKIQSFVVPRQTGINYKTGIWHFPLISMKNMNFLVVDRKGKGKNLVIHKFKKDKIILKK